MSFRRRDIAHDRHAEAAERAALAATGVELTSAMAVEVMQDESLLYKAAGHGVWLLVGCSKLAPLYASEDHGRLLRVWVEETGAEAPYRLVGIGLATDVDDVLKYRRSGGRC